MLVCPVRGCRLPLERAEQRLLCPRRHSFDYARAGYINLLQPQDRRSKEPGDTREAVAARRRLHDLGVTAPLLRGIADVSGAASSDSVLDAGCGDGFYLGSLAAETGCQAHGVDISVPAVEAAARRYPAVVWVVANADRFIPWADESFSLILSITARMNVPEFRRLLRTDGRLLIALPAPDDLNELRGEGRDRTERTIAQFAECFEVAGKERVTTTADLSQREVEDVLRSIYRPLRREPAQAMRVTFSLDLLLFRPLHA